MSVLSFRTALAWTCVTSGLLHMTVLPCFGSLPLVASFALPLVALGAAAGAAALPVLIHLLSRQRFQIVEWAAMRFLLAAQKRHRRRIDRWLLLLMRMLALLLPLAGLCAATPWAEDIWQAIRPGPPETVINAPRTHRIFVLDASLSMTTRVENRTRFDVAVSQVEQAIQSANAGDGFTLILLAGPAQAIVPGPSADAEKVLAELRSLKVTHGTADFASGLAMIADTVSRSPRSFPRRQVMFFTDLQRSAWAGLLPKPDGTAPEIWQRVLPRADVAIVDAATGDTDNTAITDVSLSDPLPLVDAPTALTVSVQNFGRTDKKQVRVELHLGRPSASGPDATLLPIEQRMIEAIPAGQRISVTFALEGAARFRESGLHLLQAKLVEADELPADDVRTLAVEVRESLPTVLVNGKPASDPFRRASEYLQEALDPAGRRLPGNPARPKTLSLTEFSDPTLGDLTGVDCVFLCDVPTLGTAQVARLKAHLKRGGGVVIGLGPNALANLDFYNKVLYNEGDGLLPGKLLGVNEPKTADDLGFRLIADEDSYRRPPLAAFRDDNVRAGLTTVPFKRYIKLDAPADGRARRILSFVPAAQLSAKPKEKAAKTDKVDTPDKSEKPDAAIVEWPRHRGRVVVYTSTFNTDWNDWPVLPTFLPFAHELLRYTAGTGDRHTLRVGEAIEEFAPVNMVGLSAGVVGPEGIAATLPVIAGDESGLVRFSDTTLSGLYRVSIGGRRDRVFAVNVPESIPGGGSESDLRRLDPAELRPLGTITVVNDPTDPKLLVGSDGLVTLVPRPHGPMIARWLLTAGLIAILAELLLAWRFGPARSGGMAVQSAEQPRSNHGLRSLGIVLALVPIAFTLGLFAVITHYEWTGELIGFLPESMRNLIEQVLGVPTAGAGEGTRWRLESFSVYVKNTRLDHRLLLGIGIAALIFVVAVYRLERRAAGRISRVVVPVMLRTAAIALILFFLLPQLRLAFDREGWPDIAVLLDTSASMATVDELQDADVKAKATQLAKLDNLSQVDRLRLAKLLLTRGDGDLLTRLLTERQFKVHVYSIADQAKLVAELNEPGDATAGKDAVNQLKADGESSLLGDGVQAVLKAFRGSSLAAIIVYTDGVTTAGDELSKAGREAARSGVPLYLVGIGDTREPPDVILSDLKAVDVVLKNDTLIFEARLTSRGIGANSATSVPVVLYERQGEKLVERARESVRLDPSGKPVPVRLTTVPKEVGEKTYVIDVPVQPNESETVNNRLERVVLVAETKRLKVLYIEASPRYEFRFMKVLLERENDAILGNKTIALNTLLLDSSPGYAEQDKSALRTMPTKAELFAYDVVILGDVDPNLLPRANQTFQDLADFVKVRGGGLLFIAGEHSTPSKLFATPLADLLPIVPSDTVPRDTTTTAPIVDGYRPKLTPYGMNHPLFRLTADEAENARVWAGLKPLFWAATGYKRKLTAEVLAVHPDRPADGFAGENHPIALQQFVGSGRVMFFGFDETWRWRFRQSEERYNQFWLQAAQVLSRNRVTRAELKTDKQTAYRRDEPIRITVRFPDDAPAPAADAPIKVLVERAPLKKPDGTPGVGSNEAQTVQLAKVDGTRATYQTLLTRTPEGEYRFFLTEPAITGSRPRAEAKVLPPPGERDRIEMNRAELLRAATESRGKFYTLADADKVIDDLPEVPRVPLNQPMPPIPLWNHALAFALLVALLGAEWLLRRRERLL